MPNLEFSQEEKLAGLIAFEALYQARRNDERSWRAPAELLYHSIATELQIELTRANARIAELEAEKVGK